MTITDIFTDLEVISMIKENDKLCIRDGHIKVEVKSNPRLIAVRRWINNDSRRSTLMEINNTIQNALQICKESFNDNEKLWTVEQFKKHFTNVIVGLNNLKKTYHEDSYIIARIIVLNNMLEEEIRKINEITFNKT